MRKVHVRKVAQPLYPKAVILEEYIRYGWGKVWSRTLFAHYHRCGKVNPRTLIPSKISGVKSKERWERLYVKIKVHFGILSKEHGTIFQLEHVAS